MLNKVYKVFAVAFFLVSATASMARAANSGTYGVDISSAGYDLKDGYYTFYMNLTVDPTTISPGIGYGFYLNTDNDSSTGGSVTFKDGQLPDATFVGIDRYFLTPTDKTGNVTFFDLAKAEYKGWTGRQFSSLPDGPVFTASGTRLEWKIAANAFSGPFWWGAVQKEDGKNLKLISTAATPIPAAGWLLGTGLMGLVAVRRRKA